MNGWGIAGWVLLVAGSTAFVARLCGMQVKGKPPKVRDMLMVAVAGMIMASLADALPADAWTWRGLWLAVVAFVVLCDTGRRGYRRYKVAQAAERAAESARWRPQPPEPPAEVNGLNFDVLLVYGRKGKRAEERRVTVHTVHIGRNQAGRPAVTMIDGYCHLRKGPRSFNVSSMIEVADGATGEVIADPADWLLGRALDR